MKKMLSLVRGFLVLLVTMAAAMFYPPTAAATDGPPCCVHADAGKTVKADQPAIAAPSIAGFKRLNLLHTRPSPAGALGDTKQAGFILNPVAENHGGHDVKDAPHIR